ncbi:alpha-1,2-fucosyltransferase [Flavobacterium sp. NG2]|uniref:alpha-1,2-fucosyltransferase n=1 Tax=Flavobacterium sp. NG2 TaxID=3097547 RepID=UPI002A81D427|nr:alpha-1,2-fucosyltransferase [Flavobacterium sp. NG2]WPR71652.1 alpha-1,2-fucosyltransferase [Flavobacterium sp. NG2]
MSKVFVNVKLCSTDFLGFRIGGAGLGNILFPWARAVIFAKKNNLEIIDPTWSTYKIGTYIRGEIDKRTYKGIFLSKNIKGFKKFLLLLFSKKIKEKEVNSNTIFEGKWWKVINFEGMSDQMTDIIDDYEIVKKELYKIVEPSHLVVGSINKSDHIAVHIRLGDFYLPQDEQEIRDGAFSCRLPLQWYIEIIDKIRTKFNENLLVKVFSDGNEDQLRDILVLPNVERVSGGSAISDLLSLSQSKILIASNSTFSLWASYLGRNNTIWFPGTHRVKLFKDYENVFEGEVDYNDDLSKVLFKN